MKRIQGMARLCLAVLAATALSACANLGAVRDFTAQASSIAAYTDTTTFMVSNPDRLMQSAPADASHAQDITALKGDADARRQALDSMLKIQSVATGYMGSLAGLAGDKAFSISGGVAKVQGALLAAPHFGVNPDSVNAFAAIASTVTDWIAEAIQEKEVKAMVNKHGAAMDVLLAGLVDVATSTVAILEEDQKHLINFNSYYEGGYAFDLGTEQPPPANLKPSERQHYEDQMNTARIRRDAARLLVKRSNQAAAAEQQAALDSARAVLSGAQAVQQGHIELRKSIDHLTSDDVVARLRQLTADLKTIQTNLKTL